MLHIGIDDTDSTEGGCTTWLATQIISELSEFDLISYPRLVRLNPNVPWKTRGNAAVALTFGKGIGPKEKVGESSNSEIFAFSKGRDIAYSSEDIVNRIKTVVSNHSHPDSQPGIVLSDVFLPEGLYWEGVRNIVSRETLESAIEGAVVSGFRGSRGIFGAACSLAWPGYSINGGISHTWELIGYRAENMWGTKRQISSDSVKQVSEKRGVFSCCDDDGRIAMVPNTPCPVLWGFRGTDKKEVVDNYNILGPEKPARWLLYKTNQATDDHLSFKEISDLREGDSVWLEAIVSSRAETIEGGHRFFSVSSPSGDIVKCAAFEPTKTLRRIVDELEPSDSIIVCGSFKNNTINIEKMKIEALATRYKKPKNPICECGKSTHSVGKNSYYRCKKCGKKYDRPEMIKFNSDITLGWYGPPPSSSRHLSTPVSLTNNNGF